MENDGEGGMRLSLLAALIFGFAIPAPPAPSVDDGAKLFAARCAACHDHPTGRTPPHFVLIHLGPDAVYRALKSGPMRQQAVGMSDADIASVIFYLTHQVAGTGGGDPLANKCPQPGGPIDLGLPGWNGWGRDPENTRYQ